MCLAIYKPAGIVIPESKLQSAFENNDDGAGFAVALNGKMLRKRGYFTFQKFIENWRGFAELQAVIHFRIATAGKTNVANCHPFLAGKQEKYAIAHNGILQHRSCKKFSDTCYFVSDALRPLADNHLLLNPITVAAIESYVGYSNKLVILCETGEHAIVNESKGHWQDGAWYSNYSATYSCAWRSQHRSAWWDKYDSKTTTTGELLEVDRGYQFEKHFAETSKGSGVWKPIEHKPDDRWANVDAEERRQAEWSGDEYVTGNHDPVG